jgi:membrane protease YdiL (CAAX protease family)
MPYSVKSPDQDPAIDEAQSTHAFRPLLFYLFSFAIAWIAWTPLLLHQLKGVDFPVPYPVVLFICQTIGAFAPLLSLVLLGHVGGDPGLVMRVFRNCRFKGVGVSWMIFPAVIPIGIAVITSVVHSAISPTDRLAIFRPGPLSELGWALVIVIPFSFGMGLIGSPLGEEPGWRGFIVDRFAEDGLAIPGSALVAVMWWIWHVPLLIVLGVTPNVFSFLEMAGHSLLIDSVFLFSGRNLLVAMLYHQGLSTSFMFFASRTQTVYGLVILLVTAIAVRIVAERHLRRELGRSRHWQK